MPDQVSASTAMAESFQKGRQTLNFKYGEFAIFKSNGIRGEHHFADVGKMIELGREVREDIVVDDHFVDVNEIIELGGNRRGNIGKYTMDFYNILLAKNVHYATGLMNFGTRVRSTTTETIVARKAAFFPQRILLWKVRFLSLLFQLLKAVLSRWTFLVPKTRLFANKEFHVVRALKPFHGGLKS